MLYLDLKDFSLNNKNNIYDENNTVKYWSQPDFAYKSRVHVYDASDNEIGYVQFKILSIQEGITYCDKEDNLIQMNDFELLEQTDKYSFRIKHNDLIIDVVEKDNRLVIEDSKDIDLNRCILFIVSLLNKE